MIRQHVICWDVDVLETDDINCFYISLVLRSVLGPSLLREE